MRSSRASSCGRSGIRPSSSPRLMVRRSIASIANRSPSARLHAMWARTTCFSALTAKSGAGKSYFTKLMALRNLLFGVDFLVIDPEDEYRTLCDAVGGQYVRLASSSAQHLNPFDLPPPDDDWEGRDPLAEQVAALLALLEIMLAEPGRPLGSYERAILDRALYRTYAAKGIEPDPATHDKPAPLMRDLLTALAGEPGDTGAELATRLQRYVIGS